MISYAIKTAYGQAEPKKVRIFKLSLTDKINLAVEPEETAANRSMQIADKNGQSVVGLTRPYPTFTCQGALTYVGPLTLTYGIDPAASEIIVDFPNHADRPLVFCKTEEQLQTTLADNGIRVLEVEEWVDGASQ